MKFFTSLKLLNKKQWQELQLKLGAQEAEIASATEFIKEIEKGNLEESDTTNVDPNSLTGSLISMRNKMKIIAQEERERNWVTEGLAKFSEILRSNNKDLDKLSNEIICELVRYVGANQGGLYLINNRNEADAHIELIACYAYERKKHVEQKFQLGEGLIGQAALEKQTIYMTDVPNNYVRITSGLGESLPRNIIIVPLKIEEDVYGIVELASFQTIKKHQILFLEKLSESLASTIATVKNSEQTQVLLQNSQMQAEQLRAQEEEMRQNMEELAATQEESTRKQMEMDSQFAAINSTSAYIEFDPHGTILNANPLFLQTMKYTLDEIKGKQHKIFIDQEYAVSREYEKFWSDLRAGLPQTGEFKRISKNGADVWILASYTPVLDQKGNVTKVIKLASDITEQKLKTANFQGQLEAINKSSAVIEFDLDGNILSANSLFCNTMQYAEEEILGKHHEIFVDADYKKSAEYKTFWSDLKKGEYKAGEFKRQNRTGDEIWIQGSYNPIHDLNGKPYKVVKFASDVTAQKHLQLEAQRAAEDLRAQEEELRQNLEEMHAIQEKFEKMEIDYKNKIAELEKKLLKK